MSRTRIKICGITREADAQAAERAGCDAIGFVFWPGSPRYISFERARAIAGGLSPLVTKVGVFVSPSVEDVARATQHAGLDAAQLCGPLDIGSWKRGSLGIRLIRALGVTEGELPEWDELDDVGDYLLDVHDSQQHGGTGRTFDWNLVRGQTPGRRIWLAGGLSVLNVARAIDTMRPFAVDVSTGVEVEPGVKSKAQIDAFVAAVRAADAAAFDGSANRESNG